VERRSWTVVGVGGVGGYYGSRLALAGFDVHWVARNDVEHLRRNGLVVTSPKGDVHLTGLAVSGPDDPLPDTDVVVVATKTTANPEVVAWLADRLAGRACTLVVLQNGFDVERPFAEALAGRAPDVEVVGGMSFICSARTGPGVIAHVDYERVTVGAFVPGGAGVAAVAAVVEDLVAADVPTEALADLVEGRWRKLVWNIPFNGLSVVLDATTAEMVTDPEARALVRSLMLEVIAASVGTGHAVEEAFIDTMFHSTERMVPYAPSMKLDYEARRELELDAIYAAPLRAASAAGVDMARTTALYEQLAFLDRRNRAGG
jgi:2-dehydropantoate 2-reductase